MINTNPVAHFTWEAGICPVSHKNTFEFSGWYNIHHSIPIFAQKSGAHWDLLWTVVHL
jgi:hypothetical protein